MTAMPTEATWYSESSRGTLASSWLLDAAGGAERCGEGLTALRAQAVDAEAIAMRIVAATPGARGEMPSLGFASMDAWCRVERRAGEITDLVVVDTSRTMSPHQGFDSNTPS